MNKFSLVSVMTALVVAAGVASSWASNGPSEQHRGKGPPPEAFEACTDKSEGATVTITTPRGDTIQCICRIIDGRLVAVPGRGTPPDHGREAPPASGAAGGNN